MPKAPSSVGRNDETTIHLNTEPDTGRRKNREVYNLKQTNWKCKLRLSLIINTAISIIVLLVVSAAEFGFIPNYKQGYICGDVNISYKYTGDTISAVTLFIVTAFVPLFLFIFIEFARSDADRKSTKILIWRWMREYLVGMFITLLIVEVMKLLAGEPRPHFMDTCIPDNGKTCTPGSYVPQYKCTNKEHSWFIVLDSVRSFPSGHSAVAMYMGMYCAGFVQFRYQPRKLGRLMKSFLMSLLILWGFGCSMSRITDHRHHWWDVLVGIILGICGAIYTIIVLCSRFRLTRTKPAMECASTTTLFDIKNRDATSVII